MNWDEAKEIIHEKSDWEELAEECSILVKKIGLTKEDSDQIVYKVRHPEWDQIRADILMFMLQYIEDLHELITSTNKIYSFQRGHKIIYFNNEWLYDDNYTSIQIERPCVRCGKMSTKEGYDACLGHIEGISHACCGHGIEHPYYVTNEGEYKTEL